MGQLTSPDGCPLCGGPNDGKWTCPPCADTVSTFRNLVRSLTSWKSMYEACEVSDVITDAAGHQWSLWDCLRFYRARDELVHDPERREGDRWQPRLPRQMARAIQLFLYENRLESEAAVLMGNAPTSPVGMYATIGLTRLLRAVYEGDVPGLHFPLETGPVYWVERPPRAARLVEVPHEPVPAPAVDLTEEGLVA